MNLQIVRPQEQTEASTCVFVLTPGRMKGEELEDLQVLDDLRRSARL